MINPGLLSDTLATQVANEVVYSRLRDAVIGHVTNGIAENVSKELLDISIAYINELKRKLFFEKLYKSLVPYEKKFKKMLSVIWEEERKIILANIKKMRKSYLTKDAIDQLLYPKTTYEEKLSEQAAEIILIVLGDKGKQTMQTIGVADVAFDVTNPEVEKWLNSYTPKFSAKLEEVSVSELRDELLEGIELGEGIPELTERVNLTYDNWNKVRSETIARSEVMRANNRAALEAYKQSGIVEKKIWIANPGACEWCAPLDGKVVGLRENFYDLGSTLEMDIGGKTRTLYVDYEAIEGGNLHPRCRCTVSAWFEE